MVLILFSFLFSGNSSFIWSTPCVLLLLSLYEEHAEQFNKGLKKHKQLWKDIAHGMSAMTYKLTWSQCQTKLNGLKRTYKKIIDHNSKSGNARSYWPFFDVSANIDNLIL